MSQYEQFKKECEEEIRVQGEDSELKDLSRKWMDKAHSRKYSYHYEWLGRPIIQYPQDIMAMQEIIWEVKPDLIIETGIAHGGSLIFSASMLELLSSCGHGEGKVLGIDIDIRPHNRKAIEEHPMAKRIEMIEGSSVAPEIIRHVHEAAEGKERVLVCLDSNHTHEHVQAELEAYAHLATVDSYCIVFDTVIEDLPDDACKDRPWGKGNNPRTAVRQWLKSNANFVIDRSIADKLLISVAPDGFLKRVQ